MKPGIKKTMFKKTISISFIWFIVNVISSILSSMGIRIENILLLYLLGILVSVLETSSIIWGISTAVIFVCSFNYFFVSPKYTFAIADPNYIISLIVFVLAAVVESGLAIKLQKQILIANNKNEMTRKLNEIGNNFLTVSGYEEIISYSEKSFLSLLGKNVTVVLNEDNDEFAAKIIKARADEYMYLPIESNDKLLGAVLINFRDGVLTHEEQEYARNVINQIVLVIERENLEREREKNITQMEKERLKSTLLRSISHDLRTPLTGIAGNANFLLYSFNELDEENIKNMLNDICIDAEWLNGMVENLLNMTRIQEERLDIVKQMEVVEDLISSAVGLVEKRIGEHTLKVDIGNEILLVFVDARLFIQVLVNLLDNAFRHSGKYTTVIISAFKQDNYVIFRIMDNGRGIPCDKMEQIFDNFFTTAYRNGDAQRGVGLGLTICKAIVEAHNGKIEVYNRNEGGACFELKMPMEESI